MNQVCLSDNRSCFEHEAILAHVGGRVSGPVFARLGWSGLGPMFAEIVMVGGLTDQLWEDS